MTLCETKSTLELRQHDTLDEAMLGGVIDGQKAGLAAVRTIVSASEEKKSVWKRSVSWKFDLRS
jgi:hypothetical protein